MAEFALPAALVLKLFRSVMNVVDRNDETEFVGDLASALESALQVRDAGTVRATATFEMTYLAHVVRAIAYAARDIDAGRELSAELAPGLHWWQRIAAVMADLVELSIDKLAGRIEDTGRGKLLAYALENAAGRDDIAASARRGLRGSAVYRALLDDLTSPSLADDADRLPLPPHLRLRFDNLAASAYAAATAGPELSAALAALRAQSAGDDLVQLMEAQARFGERHVFGNVAPVEVEDDIVPFMPLDAIYVEPEATMAERSSRFGPVVERADSGAIAKIEALLDAGARVVFVEQAFGHGKSLTARVLARERSQAALAEGGDACLFGTCQHGLEMGGGDDALQALLERTVAATGRRVLEGYDRQRAEIPDRETPCMFVIDGLDEAGMSNGEIRSLVRAMLDAGDRGWRFVVFTRPSALAGLGPRRDDARARLHLEPFDRPRREQWLSRWRLLRGTTESAIEALAGRLDTDAYSSPILLFMAALMAEHSPAVLNDPVTLYEHFCTQVAVSKFRVRAPELADDDPRIEQHTPVFEASAKLYCAIRSRITLPPLPDVGLSNEPGGDSSADAWLRVSERDAASAMLWMLSRVAWDIAVGWQRGGARVGADADLPIEVAPDRLREIAQAECEGVDADDVAHVVSSVLLVAQGAGSRGFLLGHRSFIEYLSVRYWLSELLWMLPKKQTDEDVVRVIRVLGEGDILDLSEAAQEFCDELWSLLELVVGSDCAARQVTLNKLASIIDDPTMIRAEAGHVSVDSDPRMPVRWFAMAVAGAVSTGISRPGRWYDQPVSRLDILPWRATQVPTLIRLSAVRGRHARSIKVPGVNLSSCELAGIWAPGADLAFADLSGANLTCATLTDASLFSAVLSNARCVAAWLSSCDLAGSQLDNCDLSHAHLDSAELDSADMRGAWIVDASFAGASMASVKMIGCELGKDAMVMASHQGRSVTARHSVRARLAGALYSSSTTLTDPGFTWPDDAINVDELAPDDAENGTA